MPHHIGPTLAIRQLARSIYNRYNSGTHVPRWDHHCLSVTYINHQAVGECNYRYFLLFLVTRTSVCFYGAVVVLRWVWDQVEGGLESLELAAAASTFSSSHNHKDLRVDRMPPPPPQMTPFTVLPRLGAMLKHPTFTTLLALAMATAGTALACFCRISYSTHSSWNDHQ